MSRSAFPVPFTALAKPNGAACNLNCTYCFFLSKELLYDEVGQKMSLPLLRTYLANLFDSQPDGEVVVAWQGGEPTLRGLDFYKASVDIAHEVAHPGQTPVFTMQTNGTLLNDAWGEFLQANRVLVGISLDGPEDIHDGYRVNKAGRGTHAQVIRGYHILRDYAIDTNILCTVHHLNEHRGAEVYTYFTDELDAAHIQFIPIVERVEAHNLSIAEQGWFNEAGKRLFYQQRGDHVTSRSVSPEGWGEFLQTAFDQWITRDVGRVFVQHFEAMLGAVFGQYSVCVSAPTCGFALAVEYNGDIYACDHYVEPAYNLGNIADVPMSDLLMSPRQQAFGYAKEATLSDICRRCDVRWACHGGCPKDRFVALPSTSHEHNYLCAGYKHFYQHAQPAVREMASIIRANGDVRTIMDRYATPR